MPPKTFPLILCVLLSCGVEAPAGPAVCPGVGDGAVRALGDTVLGDTVLGDTVLGDTVLGDTVLGDTVFSDTVSREHLSAWIHHLAAPEMRGRHATSPEAATVALLLAEQMAALGLAAPFPRGRYCQPFPLLGDTAMNVVAHLPAAAAGPGADAVLVSAHYDGQGLHPAGLVYPSADDNASGVAALLETARLATRREWPFDLVFVAFGAEELGQLGARAWLREPTIPVSGLRLVINFDMVGRPWPAIPAEAIGYRVGGPATASMPALLTEAGAEANVEVRPLLHLQDDMATDTLVFEPSVPTLDLSTGLHADHHQRTDTVERVDVRQTARAVALTLSVLETLARP